MSKLITIVDGEVLAPRAERMKLKRDIAAEIYAALERLDAPPELLSVIGSYGDTLTDDEVLMLLREWNATGKVMHTPQ